jgi:predicted acylesterase/phospholipase RssA
MARNNKASDPFRRKRTPLVPANPDAPLTGNLEQDWKAIEARPVSSIDQKPAMNVAVVMTDLQREVEIRRLQMEEEHPPGAPYIPSSREQIKAIFNNAAGQMEAAKKAGQAAAEEWHRQYAAEQKRNENEKLERLSGPRIISRPIGQ